jgi:hypothetical protein
MKTNPFARSLLKMRIALLLLTILGLAAMGSHLGNCVAEFQDRAAGTVEIVPPPMDISKFLAAAR